MRRVGGACCLVPQQHNIGATAGRLHKALVRRRTTMQSIPEGAASRVPGLCERFNGLRDPNMTLVLTGRICYSRMGRHPGPSLEFCNYLMLQPGSHYPKVC
jgi:hypothetical protein